MMRTVLLVLLAMCLTVSLGGCLGRGGGDNGEEDDFGAAPQNMAVTDVFLPVVSDYFNCTANV